MATSHSDTAILTFEQSFTYRGAREHWQNAYHLDQVPADTTAWDGLASQVAAFVQAMLPSNAQLEHYYGHNPGTPPVLVWEKDIPPTGEGGVAGTFTPIATEHQAPGDDAVFIRYGTTQKSTRGKPIYLWNYYHAVFYDATPDTFSARQKTAFDALGAKWISGFNQGGTTFRRAGPRGAVAQNFVTSPWITTRTLKARGKRKKVALTGTASDTPVIVDFGSLWRVISGAPR